MTKGEYIVGVSFNPSQDPTVAEIKDRAARLIDLIDSIVGGDVSAISEEEDVDVYAAKMERWCEVERLKELAMEAIEEGAMWAVKAATKPERKD
jgi:hypothetical protein